MPSLKAGDTLICTQRHSDCLRHEQEYTVHRGGIGLFVVCRSGRHFVSRHVIGDGFKLKEESASC